MRPETLSGGINRLFADLSLDAWHFAAGGASVRPLCRAAAMARQAVARHMLHDGGDGGGHACHRAGFAALLWRAFHSGPAGKPSDLFPIMALMLCSMAALLLPLPPLLWAVEGLEQLSYALLEWLCSFRGGILYADSAALLITYAGIACLVGVCFAHRHDKQQHRRLALLCALVLIAGAIAAAPAQGDALVVAMIDVGQGMSVLVQDGGADVLVDCGSESVQDAPERIIRALQSRGVYSLDTLVLTICTKTTYRRLRP